MQQKLSNWLLAIYLVFLYLQSFQGLLRNEKRTFPVISLRTWLISREKLYDVTHFSRCTHIRIICQTKKMLWHLLTESRFIPSTSKPFVIAMPLLLTSWHVGLDQLTTYAFFENSKIADKLREGTTDAGHSCG